jgi:hypothetical protein
MTWFSLSQSLVRSGCGVQGGKFINSIELPGAQVAMPTVSKRPFCFHLFAMSAEQGANILRCCLENKKEKNKIKPRALPSDALFFLLLLLLTWSSFSHAGTTNKRSKYVLCASSDAERADWIKAMRKV